MVQKIEKCPVTGLPIVRKPQWTDIRISDDFMATYRLIGDRILHAIPRGHFGKMELKKLYTHLDQVLKETAAPGAPGVPGVKIVEIDDLKNITGSPTPAGMMNISRYFEREPGRYLGLIAFNASRKTRLFLRMVWRIRKEPYPFEIENDYESAVKRAVK